jgi:hypothetical protein
LKGFWDPNAWRSKPIRLIDLAPACRAKSNAPMGHRTGRREASSRIIEIHKLSK